MLKQLGINAQGVLVTDEISNIDRVPNGNYQYLVTPTGQQMMIKMSDIKNVGEIFYTDTEKAVYDDIVKMIRPDVKELMNRVKKTFKFNYLFYGSQGTGKGMFVQRMINDLEEKWDGPIMVFSDQIDDVLSIDRWIRGHFGDDHNILMIFVEDECERYMYVYKKILDSSISPNNMISFWMTNKIHDIHETVWKNRPSRISRHHEFGDLTSKESKQFIDFLVNKFKEEGLMEEFTDEQLETTKQKLKNKSKDYISSELMMSLIMEKLGLNKKEKTDEKELLSDDPGS